MNYSHMKDASNKPLYVGDKVKVTYIDINRDNEEFITLEEIYYNAVGDFYGVRVYIKNVGYLYRPFYSFSYGDCVIKRIEKVG